MPQALNLPVVPKVTDVLGIHQSDILIRSTLILAIQDLRKNPWLLDYAFASLPRDPETAATYGEQEVSKAKQWFLSTEVSVRMNMHISDVKFPMISIGLVSSTEQEQEGTLGDTHYQPFEDADGTSPELAGPFTPFDYNSVTGVLEFDPDELGDFVPGANMLVVDAEGRKYPFEVVDGFTVKLRPGTRANFDGCLFEAAQPSLKVETESTVYREVYAIGCHVDSEPVHLVYLHSIVVFALLRYKQALLEARGFERSTLSSSDFRRDDPELPEFFYTRYVQVTGTVRQAWPKAALGRITSVPTTVLASMGEGEAFDLATQDASSPTDVSFSTKRVYWGTATQPGSVDEAFVLALGSRADVPSRQMAFAFEADPNEYLWWALPVAFGGQPTDFVDTDNQFDIGVALVTTLDVDGVPCNVFRSNQHSLGVVLARVK